MVWNYRVIENDGMFYIHEVYYNEAGEIVAISEDPISPAGETLDELKGDLEYYIQVGTCQCKVLIEIIRYFVYASERQRETAQPIHR